MKNQGVVMKIQDMGILIQGGQINSRWSWKIEIWSLENQDVVILIQGGHVNSGWSCKFKMVK